MSATSAVLALFFPLFVAKEWCLNPTPGEAENIELRYRSDGDESIRSLEGLPFKASLFESRV